MEARIAELASFDRSFSVLHLFFVVIIGDTIDFLLLMHPNENATAYSTIIYLLQNQKLPFQLLLAWKRRMRRQHNNTI